MPDSDAPADTFFSTCVRVIFSPRELFDSLSTAERRRWGPVSFALAVGALSMSLGAFTAGLLEGSVARAIGLALAWLFASPFVTIAGLYISAAIFHASLVVLGARRGPYRATLACVAYASAPALFGVVPVIGVLIGTIWQGVVLVIGLARVHRAGVVRPLVAVLAMNLMPVLVALGLRAGVVEAFKIPSGSMSPTLVIGDHLFVSKLAYGPLIPGTERRLYARLPPRADVVVFRFPENPAQDFIKRVIGTPGDRLEFINGRPVINGWLVPHCHVGPILRNNRPAELFVEFFGERSYFTLFDTSPDEQACRADADCAAGHACRGGICGVPQGPFHVAPEELWVVGDDRHNSHDSRSWRGGKGAGVPFDHIKGRATSVWMSFLPGGGIAQDRLFLDVHGPPKLPVEYEATLGPAVEKCLRERPSQTMPPAAHTP